MNGSKKGFDKFIDNFLEIFFSKDRIKLHILIIFLLGFILRLINALNHPITVDAAGHTVMALNFISSGKLGDWGQSVGLWDFLTDLAYKMFGMNDFSSRFWVIIFGSFSIILIFLLVKEMFDERVGLIAAFLLAVSPFHISETIPEMDVMALFFSMLGMLLFIMALKQDKRKLFFYSGMIIGVGILIKIYVLLFIPFLVLYSAYYSRKYKKAKKPLIKNIVVFGVATFIFCLVPVISNYLLYKDKGFVDHIFTDTLGLWNEKSKQYFGWIYPYVHEYKFYFFGSLTGESKVHAEMKLPGFVYTYGSPLYLADRIVLFLGVIGLIISLKKRYKDYFILFLCGFFTIGLYLGSVTGLMIKHYLFVLIFMIPPAALAINEISKKIKLKILLFIMFVAILIFQLYWLSIYTQGHFYEKSSMNNLMSYKIKNIPQDALVVVDSRIFRGFIGHLFHDKHYIESSLLGELLNQQENMPGEYYSREVYFIECASDDCGWGTIRNQPEFNQSMEKIVEFFENNSKLEIELADSRLDIGLSFVFRVYKTNLMLKPAVLQAADSTHIFFMYPIGYDERITPIFDKYETYSIMDKLIDKIAHWIFWFSAFLAVFSILVVFYLFVNESVNKDGLKNET